MKITKLAAAMMVAGSGLALSGSTASAMQQGVSHSALYAGQYQPAYYGGYRQVADKTVAPKPVTELKKAPHKPVHRAQFGAPGYGYGGPGYGQGYAAGNGRGAGNASGKASGNFKMGFGGNVKGNAAGNSNWAGSGRGYGQNYAAPGFNNAGPGYNPWQAQVQKVPKQPAITNRTAQAPVRPPQQVPMNRGSHPGFSGQAPGMQYGMPGGMRPGQMRGPNMQMPNMRMPNMRMPNMRMPNMNMPNMRMPNVRMQPPVQFGYNRPPWAGQRMRPGMQPRVGVVPPLMRPAPAPQMRQVQPQGQQAPAMGTPKQPWFRRWGSNNQGPQGQRPGWWKRWTGRGQQQQGTVNVPAPQQAPNMAPQQRQAAPVARGNAYGQQQRPPYPQGWMQGGPNGPRGGMAFPPYGGFYGQPTAPWMGQQGNVAKAPATKAKAAVTAPKPAAKGDKESK